MNIRSSRITALVLCLVVTAQLTAAPSMEVASLFARFRAYLQSKLSPPIGAQGRLSPPIPGQPPSDTELTTTKVAPRQP